jgi:MFS family permease
MAKSVTIPGRSPPRLRCCELTNPSAGLRLRRKRGSRVHKRSTWVAWSMLAIYLVEWILQSLLSAANGNLSLDGLALLLAFTAFMVMGALIVAHQPRNAIGWIFSAIGLLTATGGLAQEYAEYAYITRPGSLPGAILAVWYSLWWWYPTLFLVLVFTLFLFPTGRLLSRRWRPVFWLAATTTAAFTMLAALSPGLNLDENHAIRNPLGIGWVEDVEKGVVGAGLFVLLSVSEAAALASLVLRFRRSRGEERQQLKWFTYAGALLLLIPLGDFLPNRNLSTAVFGLLIAFLPIAAGLAILRYRLYDIDRIINRTLVYGLLSVLLGAVYAGVVLILGQLSGGVGANPSSWAVAGATLAAAALFQPARRRIQQVVDRRFNRRKYNAAKTIQAFSTRLRDQLDLGTLATELVAVVDQTMEPTRVSLWLRPSPNPSPDTPHRDAQPTTWAY